MGNPNTQVFTVTFGGSLGAVHALAARDVRSNGVPLTNLRAIQIPGRLDFVATPVAGSDARRLADGLRSLGGSELRVVISDPRAPGQSRSATGRITGIAVDPSDPSGAGGGQVRVAVLCSTSPS